MAVHPRAPKGKRERSHDTSDPAIITDHAFEPRGAWYTLCKHCGLAQAAHAQTTIDARDHMTTNRRVEIHYMGDDADGYTMPIE